MRRFITIGRPIGIRFSFFYTNIMNMANNEMTTKFKQCLLRVKKIRSSIK